MKEKLDDHDDDSESLESSLKMCSSQIDLKQHWMNEAVEAIAEASASAAAAAATIIIITTTTETTKPLAFHSPTSFLSFFPNWVGLLALKFGLEFYS